MAEPRWPVGCYRFKIVGGRHILQRFDGFAWRSQRDHSTHIGALAEWREARGIELELGQNDSLSPIDRLPNHHAQTERTHWG